MKNIKKKIKKDGVHVEDEKSLELEENEEIQNVNMERMINRIKKDFYEVYKKL